MQVIDSETPPSLYARVGGETGIQQLVDHFYDTMDSLPEVKKTRDLHAKSLRVSRRKLFMFLSGWMGGPPLYAEKYGHPRLRRRHLPFAIGTEERDQWMLCMEHALKAMPFDDGLRSELHERFMQVADHMRNQPEAGETLHPCAAGAH